MSGSLPDFSIFFSRYEDFSTRCDDLFIQVLEQFPKEASCTVGCSDCCHAMFDLSLIETLYLNKQFFERFSDGMDRSIIIDKADQADRHAFKLKRDLFKESQSGKDNNAILSKASRMNIRCPLLDDNNTCLMYDVRPITCRLYGVPTSIGGHAYTCSKTSFIAGSNYPTINMDTIQNHLLELSVELAQYIGSSYKELHTMYVPVSTALITVFDASYLGIGGFPKEEEDV